jgi:hypothetical protein
MSKKRATRTQIRDAVQAYRNPIDRACWWAWDKTQQASAILGGNLYKRERSGNLHRSLTNEFRRMVDLDRSGALQLIEEPDGKELNLLLMKWEGVTIALRWSRYHPDYCVMRNRTQRSMAIEECNYLPGLMVEADAADKSIATLGLVILNDETLGGVSQAYLQRVALIRECENEAVDFMCNVALYDKPAEDTERQYRMPASVQRHWDDESAQMSALLRKIG